ncbi:MAG: hypothetical protein ACTSYZ_06555 [Candidatus Helarchaeota archaeon]
MGNINNDNNLSNLKEKWKEATRFEGYGHDYYYIKEYEKASESHLKASEIFKEISSISKNDMKIRAKRNYFIEYGNYLQCKASHQFYKVKNYKMAQDLFERAAEQLKEASKIKTDNLNDKKELDILNMNIHFLLEKASIAKAFYLINKEIKDYNELIEQFKLASTHDDLEADFAAQVGDIQRVSRARARKYYCEGQIFRFKGMMALQNNEIKKAKEYYLHASEFFDKSSKLDNEWDEYEKMAKKMLNVAKRLKE